MTEGFKCSLSPEFVQEKPSNDDRQLIKEIAKGLYVEGIDKDNAIKLIVDHEWGIVRLYLWII